SGLAGNAPHQAQILTREACACSPPVNSRAAFYVNHGVFLQQKEKLEFVEFPETPWLSLWGSCHGLSRD
ncbi:MAG: hypothetical protein MR883_04535, partial [Clostridiales bacterium]|nr:hypothetical protein [Clostridiales bacterium]